MIHKNVVKLFLIACAIFMVLSLDSVRAQVAKADTVQKGDVTEVRKTVNLLTFTPLNLGIKRTLPRTFSIGCKGYILIERFDAISQQTTIIELPLPDDPVAEIFKVIYAKAGIPPIYSKTISFDMAIRNFSSARGDIKLGNGTSIQWSDIAASDAVDLIKKLDGKYYLGTKRGLTIFSAYTDWYASNSTQDELDKVKDHYVEPPSNDVESAPFETSSIIVAIIYEFNTPPDYWQIRDGSFNMGTEFSLGGSDPMRVSLPVVAGMPLIIGLGSKVSNPSFALEDNSGIIGINLGWKGIHAGYRFTIKRDLAFMGDNTYLRDMLPFAAVQVPRIEIGGPASTFLFFNHICGIDWSYQYRVGDEYTGPVGRRVFDNDSGTVYKSYVADAKSYFNFGIGLPTGNVYDGWNYYGVRYYQKEWYALVQFKRMMFNYSVVDILLNYRFASPEENRSRFAITLNMGFPQSVGGDFFTLGITAIIGQGPAHFVPTLSIRPPTASLIKDLRTISRMFESDQY